MFSGVTPLGSDVRFGFTLLPSTTSPSCTYGPYSPRIM
jgi:hypothetical protein